MALARYVLTADVTVPAGIFTLDATTGLRFGTGSYAGAAGVWPGAWPGQPLQEHGAHSRQRGHHLRGEPPGLRAWPG